MFTAAPSSNKIQKILKDVAKKIEFFADVIRWVIRAWREVYGF